MTSLKKGALRTHINTMTTKTIYFNYTKLKQAMQEEEERIKEDADTLAYVEAMQELNIEVIK